MEKKSHSQQLHDSLGDLLIAMATVFVLMDLESVIVFDASLSPQLCAFEALQYRKRQDLEGQCSLMHN
jgi:hypothetical protein